MLNEEGFLGTQLSETNIAISHADGLFYKHQVSYTNAFSDHKRLRVTWSYNSAAVPSWSRATLLARADARHRVCYGASRAPGQDPAALK